MTAIGAVEIQQTQMRTIAILSAAGIFEIGRLSARMKYLHGINKEFKVIANFLKS